MKKLSNAGGNAVWLYAERNGTLERPLFFRLEKGKPQVVRHCGGKRKRGEENNYSIGTTICPDKPVFYLGREITVRVFDSPAALAAVELGGVYCDD